MLQPPSLRFLVPHPVPVQRMPQSEDEGSHKHQAIHFPHFVQVNSVFQESLNSEQTVLEIMQGTGERVNSPIFRTQCCDTGQKSHYPPDNHHAIHLPISSSEVKAVCPYDLLLASRFSGQCSRCLNLFLTVLSCLYGIRKSDKYFVAQPFPDL